VASAHASAQRLAKSLSPVSLADLLDVASADGGIVVSERTVPAGAPATHAVESPQRDVTGTAAEMGTSSGSDYERRVWIDVNLVPTHHIAKSFHGLNASSIAERAGQWFPLRMLQVVEDELRRLDRARAGHRMRSTAGERA